MNHAKVTNILFREALKQSNINTILCIGTACGLLIACSGQLAEEGRESVGSSGSLAVQSQPGRSQSLPASGDLNEVVLSDIAVVEATRQNAAANTGVRKEAEEVRVTESQIRMSRANPATSSVSSMQLLAQDRGSAYYGQRPNQENYLSVSENGVKRVSVEPVSTFSIDVDTAAYSNIRRMLTRNGTLPPADAVRIEEMINYFDYDYAQPDDLTQPLAINTEVMMSPWNPENQLVMVGIKGFEQKLVSRPNANLVFLIDVSGSMQSADKLGLVKKSLQLLVAQMTENDRIALVVYAGAAGVVLDSTTAGNKAKINQAIDSLAAGGSTNGAAGIELAYQMAEQNKIEGGINRVIIASDGDLNVGITGIDDLKELISKKRDNGVALTTLGYGTGNYNYSLMEQLADAGNGNAAYIDTLSEARKVLVEEMQSTLLTIAKDVKIQIEFNPDVVSEYRLLGYENRLLQREDFRNDKVDAGEIGSGHTVTALYEISLKGSRGALIADSRYSSNRLSDADFGDELAYVNIRYKLPEAEASTEFGRSIERENFENRDYQASEDIRFAAAVAGFGQLLSGGKYTRDWDYDQLLQLARSSRGDDAQGYRSEMLRLVELAKVL